MVSISSYRDVLRLQVKTQSDIVKPANSKNLETIAHQSVQIASSNPADDPEKANSKLNSLKILENDTTALIEALRSEVDLIPNRNPFETIRDVGMGKYNWSLFVLCGLGWFNDILWLKQVALSLPSLSVEFGLSENHVRYTTCYMYVGLCLGSIFWGVGSDIMGRKPAFNMTLFIAGLFGVVAGAAPSWPVVCALFLAMGFGVGGNLPVDGALFLEFLPNTSGRLLTLLSIWWPFGQLVASFCGWGFLGGNYAPNKGWRYSCYAMGTLTVTMSLGRFLLLHLFESPKFLLSQGRQAEAVAVVRGIAHKNKTTTWLTEDILNKFGGHFEPDKGRLLTNKDIILGNISTLSLKSIRPLFATREMARNTTVLWFCWLAIGLGYPLFNGFLPQYLSRGQKSSGELISKYIIYRNYVITSLMGLPGSILACYTVDLPYIGRRGTMIVSSLICSILLFLFTTSRDASIQLGFSAAQNFVQNIMYAVLYSYTPEVFPTYVRGTGTGIASLLNRIGGLCAPIIAANVPVENPNIPILVSGSLILSAFVAMLFLSIETRGRQML